MCSNLVHILQVTVGRTLLILVHIGWIVFFFFFCRSTKKNFYTLRPMESNSLKCSSIRMVHSIELKFGMHIIDHWPTYCVEFGEFRIDGFCFKCTKMSPYTLQPMKSNYKKHACILMVLSIKLKFDKCIADHRSSYYINFGVSRIYSYFTG